MYKSIKMLSAHGLLMGAIGKVGGITVIGCVGAGYAGMSNASGESMAPGAAGGALEEVVVTARKREERLQDIPIAVTALAENDLIQRGVTGVAELSKSVPNFTVDSQSSVGGMGMRGIVNVTRNIGFESGMGVYVDEVYVGRPAAFNKNLVDIAQVEVLRGPQGTLFGRNTIAGAINITTKNPGDELEGNIRTTFANHDSSRISAAVSGPIIENTLYGRLSVLLDNREDDYIENSAGPDIGSVRERGFRGKLRWVPRDDLEIALTVDSTTTEGASNVFELSEIGPEAPPGFSIPTPEMRQPNVTQQDFMSRDDRDTRSGSLRGIWDIADDLTLVSVTAYNEVNFEVLSDNDSRGVSLSHSSFNDDSRQFSQEFRLQGVLSERWDYTAGLFYLDQKASAERSSTATAPMNPLTGDPLTRAQLGPFFPLFVVGETNNAGNTVAPIGNISSSAEVRTEALAIFASSDFDLAENLTLNTGLRYTKEEKSLDFIQDNTSFTLHPDVVSRPGIDDGAWSGNLSLTYILDQTTLYGSISRGYKSGGFNPDIVPSGDEIVFDSETVWSYEAGLKAELADGRARVNAAVFLTDYDDLQVQRLAYTPVGKGFAITNADQAEIWGVELEALFVPVNGLTLGASIGYTDPIYKEFKECASGPGGSNAIDCDGNQLNNASKLNASAAVQYLFSIGDPGQVYVRADWSYRDEVFIEPTNTGRTRVDSRELVDARAGFYSSDQKWELAIWGKNLADKEYVHTVFYIPTFDITSSLFDIGRTYGVDIFYNF
ncbi:TonB-dependent receptor [Parahaliea mediterranea]|uniref:TonB-dependent receptor n=1 Tax=Parahaliea mediterranea TaxID=651086 RepID=A0A939DES8_9GAMM|nr:TonB-dependent receptor [Parahaliea mediterranea]MBN7796167.1 TonB-dependent receptor [Parahaliea mediterranea]